MPVVAGRPRPSDSVAVHPAWPPSPRQPSAGGLSDTLQPSGKSSQPTAGLGLTTFSLREGKTPSHLASTSNFAIVCFAPWQHLPHELTPLRTTSRTTSVTSSTGRPRSPRRSGVRWTSSGPGPRSSRQMYRGARCVAGIPHCGRRRSRFGRTARRRYFHSASRSAVPIDEGCGRRAARLVPPAAGPV